MEVPPEEPPEALSAAPPHALRPPRAVECAAGLLLLAAACGNGRAAPAVPEFDAARAWRHLERIVALGPRPAGSAALDDLRTLLRTELESYGLEPESESFTADTPVGPIRFTNVWADIPGKAGKAGSPGSMVAPMVVIGTHIDTKRMPFEFVGANDGGSGTAVLLELARLLATGAGTRPVTYRLLFLDGEEATRMSWSGDDNRYGSRHHVAQLEATRLVDRVAAFVLLDLVGDKDLVLFHETLSDSRLMGFFFDAARAAGLGRHVNGPRLEIKDDHLSFMAANVPSVDLIDFDYGPDNAYWHAPEDTLDKLSAESLGVIGRIVLLGLPALEEWAVRQ